jgi:hypothetical protein
MMGAHRRGDEQRGGDSEASEQGSCGHGDAQLSKSGAMLSTPIFCVRPAEDRTTMLRNGRPRDVYVSARRIDTTPFFCQY